MPSAATWMDLEIILQSEVSQKKKDKYHVISLMCVWSIAQLCSTLHDLIACSRLLCHGIFQARILEWVAIA